LYRFLGHKFGSFLGSRSEAKKICSDPDPQH
jgi:hypothetical protein